MRYDMRLQPAVKKETLNIIKAEIIGVLIMFAVFFVLNLIVPDTVPFNVGVIISGLLGGVVAVLNFLIMGISIQKMTEVEDIELGKKLFKTYYRYRILLQIVWGIIALVVPFLHGLAGLLPLLIPTFAIRAGGIKQSLSSLRKQPDVSTDAEDTDAEKGVD